ncbi:MAG: hypothetical protein Q9226_008330, partial [Calogaya cf. arnoldii]
RTERSNAIDASTASVQRRGNEFWPESSGPFPVLLTIMSSESLKSIYQQYKHDTEVVASWLATTAKAFGYSAQIGEPSAAKIPTKPSGRLKGKERKKAKEQAAQVPGNELPAPSEPSKPKYTLAIKDFVPLAEHIADASNAANIRVANSFSVALERVIWVRKSFAEKLEAVGRRFDQRSDARHSFFVSILEKVRKTLQPLLSVDAFNLSNLKDAVKNVGTHKYKKGLSTLFEVLDVYEPSAEFEAAPDVEPSPPNPPEYTIEAEEDSQFEALFAMTALMDDLSRLRLEIADLWRKYEAGEMDIAAVSIATNTAIELAQSFEDDISPLIQKNGGSSDFHVKYFYAVSEALGIDAEARQRSDDDYNLAAYDIADALLINPLINIIAYVRANPLGEIPCYNGLYGWYDEAPITTSGSARQKYTRMKPALLELLSDIPLVTKHPSPVEDQVLHGMMSTLKSAEQERKATPDVPIWFSFAAQLYLDTLDVVEVGKGWTDMQRVMRKVKRFVNDLPTSCQERKDFFDKGVDPIAIIRQALGKPYKKWTFFRRHFMSCGLWVHFMRTLLHQQGVRYAAVPGTVLCTTQLYHALQQENCLNHAWTDLGSLRKMQGNSTFFIGEPPSSPEGYFNNYCLTIGSSITNWAPNKRDNKVKVSKDNKPLMKFLGLTSTMFANRISPHGDRRPLSVDVVEAWIQKGSKSQGHIETEKMETPAAKKQKTQPVIHRLAAAVESEVADLEFDYFAIHNQCRELLLRLQAEEEKVTGPGFTRSYMSHGQHNLAFVVGFVFFTLAGKKDIIAKTISSTRLLEIAAETCNQWLLEGKGSAITDRASEEDIIDDESDDSSDSESEEDDFDEDDIETMRRLMAV